MKHSNRYSPELRGRLDAHLVKLTANAEISEVNGLRREVLSHARGVAAEAPGLFTLTVPTGGGKTLVGLLLAEYRRRAHGQRIAYLCPNIQLVRQAASKASGYGIPAVTLTGRQADYGPGDFRSYNRAQAVAVTTYHGVFNSNPRIDAAQTLVLDDAHAGEGAQRGHPV